MSGKQGTIIPTGAQKQPAKLCGQVMMEEGGRVHGRD